MVATGRACFSEGNNKTPLAFPSGKTPMGRIASEDLFRPKVSHEDSQQIGLAASPAPEADGAESV
jgi:hypothetical protein